MAYGYNAQGQLVYVPDGSAPPQGGTALPTKDLVGSTLIPTDPSDPRYKSAQQMDDNGLWSLINGDPGTGKKYDSTGHVVNTSFGQKLTTGFENAMRYGGEGLGMAALGALGGEGLAALTGAGAAGGGAAEALPFAGEDAVTTAAPTWQSLLAKGLEGAVQGGVQNKSWKGVLTGGLEGLASGATQGLHIPDGGVINNFTDAIPGGGATLGGGGGMDWISLIKNIVGAKGGGGSDTIPTDPGMSLPDTSSGSSGSTWQNILGDILKGTGTAGKVVGTAGDVASGIEAGRSKDRSNQNEWNLSQDKNRLAANTEFENALENRAALELKQGEAKQAYQGSAYKQALLGALGKNLQDVTASGVPSDVPVISFNGGLRPSAIGPEGRAAAALINSKAMTDLQNGLQTTALPAIEKFTPSTYQSGNAIDTILGGVGTAGKIGDIWNARGQAGASADVIKQIQDALKKQKGVAIPDPSAPGGMVMIDPTTGQVVTPDQADDASFGGASQRQPLKTPPTDTYNQDWGQ